MKKKRPLSVEEARARLDAAKSEELYAFHVFSERQNDTARAAAALREAEEREAEQTATPSAVPAEGRSDSTGESENR